MAGVDIYRGSQGVELPPEVSKEILSDMRRESIVQRLARPVRVPGAGLTIPVITDDPEADWVDETEEKPVSRAGFSSVSLKPYCAAVIQPFSKQFARDLTGLYTECRARMPGALAKKFDRTCFGFDDTPGTGFNDLDDAPTIALDDEDMYGSAIAALRSVVGSHEGADLTAWAIDPLAEVEFLPHLTITGDRCSRCRRLPMARWGRFSPAQCSSPATSPMATWSASPATGNRRYGAGSAACRCPSRRKRH